MELRELADEALRAKMEQVERRQADVQREIDPGYH